MAEAALHPVVQSPFSRVAEGGVPQVVPQGDRLGQILVEPERPRDGAGDLGNLERMGEPGAVMIPLRGKENLRFVFEAAEGLAVQDPVAVPLVSRAVSTGLLLPLPSLGPGGKRRAGVQELELQFLGTFSACHFGHPFPFVERPLEAPAACAPPCPVLHGGSRRQGNGTNYAAQRQRIPAAEASQLKRRRAGLSGTLPRHRVPASGRPAAGFGFSLSKNTIRVLCVFFLPVRQSFSLLPEKQAKITKTRKRAVPFCRAFSCLSG